MRSNALFFPYIALPDDAWTAKSLLYWDKLTSIVPRDHLERPEQLSGFMRELLKEGLVEPVMPGQYVHRIPGFDENFIRLIENRLQRKPLFNLRRSSLHNEPARLTSRIHAEKLGQIPDFLVEVGLAKRINWAWYQVERRTAEQFMAYLAACLGAIPEVNATPVTNLVRVGQYLQSRLMYPKQENRDLVLRDLLPTPAGPVELAKLLRFRRRHGRQLQRFRTEVEAHCTRVATFRNATDRIEANKAFLQECEQSIDEISENMKVSFGQVALGSLAPLFGAGLTVQATDTGNAAAYAGAALSLAGAAYLAISSIHGSRAIRNRPLAYVAHARRTFGHG